jgi:phosphohistidine swiveling domain-containing protein
MALSTPLFSSIKAVLINNTGRFLHHAVIVGHEYGIPCVAGAIDATKKIKTGDKIKVNFGLLCSSSL